MSAGPQAAPQLNRVSLSLPEDDQLTAARMETPAWRIHSRDEKAVYVVGPYAAAPEPGDWPTHLRAYLDRLGNAAVVGAKRLNNAGSHVFSMGEFVIHPKGFHHHGRQVTPTAWRFAEEVDVIQGGVMAIDAAHFDRAGGLDTLNDNDLGPIELGLRIRQNGGRAFAVPQVVVKDERSPLPTPEESATFRKTWGFDWRAADLQEVSANHGGGGLVWQARFVSPTMPYAKYGQRPAPVWVSYAKADFFRQRADHLADRGSKLAGDGLLADVGCGDGLFTHLFAKRGTTVVGFDPEELALGQARQMTAEQEYPGDRPDYRVGTGEAVPLEDESCAAASLLDVIEHLPNPVATLKELARVVKPGGKLLVVTPMWQYGGWSDAFYHSHEYTQFELTDQINAAGGWKVVEVATITGMYRDAVVTAERV
jgi:ubiquinone/menaquinone biosynthesis C-methylase UbiE